MDQERSRVGTGETGERETHGRGKQTATTYLPHLKPLVCSNHTESGKKVKLTREQITKGGEEEIKRSFYRLFLVFPFDNFSFARRFSLRSSV